MDVRKESWLFIPFTLKPLNSVNSVNSRLNYIINIDKFCSRRERPVNAP